MASGTITFMCYGFLGIIQQCELPDVSKTTVTVCPIIEPWSVNEQRRAAGELKQIGRGSASAAAIGQLIRMRDQAKACLRKKGG